MLLLENLIPSPFVCACLLLNIYIYIYILLEQNRELVIVLNFEAFPNFFCCSPHMLVWVVLSSILFLKP